MIPMLRRSSSLLLLLPATLSLLLAPPTALGFSLRPTTGGRRGTTTALAVLEAPVPKTATGTIRISGDVDDEDVNEDDVDNLETVLSILEKRLLEGPGSLSPPEVDELGARSDRLVTELRKPPRSSREEEENDPEEDDAEDEAGGWSSSAASAAEATTTTTAVVAPPPPAVEETPQPPVETEAAAASSFSPLNLESLVQQLVRSEGYQHEEEEPSSPATTASSSSSSSYGELHEAAVRLDADTVDALLSTDGDLAMDEATTEAAFWAVVRSVDKAEAENRPLSGNVPRMLHHIFEADHRHLLTREQITTNVTCMQPRDDGIEGKARAMSYIFDDSSHKDLPLTEGRRCEGGTCCDACSRNVFPVFATDRESDFRMFPELGSISFNELGKVASGTIIQFTRLIERVRRTIAHEYGLPLKSILPLQAYSRKYVAGTTQQGGGGGEGDFVTLHTDEATHDGYHYSCVMYLSTAGEDFEGGAFVFNDPAKDEEEARREQEESKGLGLEEQIRRSGRKLRPYYPTRGAAVIFSSGWENMHEVEKITSGTRYAVPCFFTTCPVPEAAYDQMAVGKPSTNEDIADDWLHLLLAHRVEMPHESTGRVKELLMKWHYMCTPLDQH
eukprot:CAMPEP_0197175886 /NCGR_PEP_ID=MMETSP1423-20130617/1977_1 /TAXON_ID=476441 /ORGANISM="Pseudo-nitzschia heimii, Strain UNC1101" /LENGTH=615 /DNA_ID=CAMNT_0042625135 /DNA_START=209 /DNA_END=2056 /DNA_ORIENTATION=+